MAIVIVIVIVIWDGGGCYILFLFRGTEEDLDFLAGFSWCLNCWAYDYFQFLIRFDFTFIKTE